MRKTITNKILSRMNELSINQLARLLGVLLKLGPYIQSIREIIPTINARLNEEEYKNGCESLKSYPKHIVIRVYSKCNAKCIFCWDRKENDEFDLQLFKDEYEKKAAMALMSASHICFCGFGEPLTIPGIKEFIEYLNEKYSGPVKAFTTNGIALNHKLINILLAGNYTLHVSLHASYAALHEQLTKTKTFDRIIENLEYAMTRRRETGSKLSILLVFVVNTLNVKDIPEFVKLAIRLGIPQIKFEYMTIYSKDQIKYSCFFEKRLTNEMFASAMALADGKVDIQLPPFFNSAVTEVENHQTCSYPWDWVLIRTDGLSYCCNAAKLAGYWERNTVKDIWNSNEYREMRRALVHKTDSEWCRHCPKGKPFQVDKFRAHVTQVSSLSEEILEEYNRSYGAQLSALGE